MLIAGNWVSSPSAVGFFYYDCVCETARVSALKDYTSGKYINRVSEEMEMEGRTDEVECSVISAHGRRYAEGG